jgi:hypothetical protein
MCCCGCEHAQPVRCELECGSSLRLGLKSWKLCKTLDIAMQAGLSFLVYSEGYAGVVSDFQGFEATRLGLNSSAAMVD